MRIVYYYIIILFLLSGCRPKEGLREEVIFLYEQGKHWEEAEQADSATAYYLQSYQLAKKLKEDSLIGGIGNTLGDILRIQALFNHAISVYKEAYSYNNKLKEKVAASHSLRGIARGYFFNMSEDSILYRARLDSSFIYFNKAESMIPQIDNQEEVSYIYNNLCVFYTVKKEYFKALDYNQKAINMTKDSIAIYKNYSCRGKLYFFLGQNDSAIYYCLQALNAANLYTQHAACHQLSKILSKIGSPDSALYLKKTFDIHATIEKQKREEEIIQLFQKTDKDGFENEKRLVVFSVATVLLLLSLFGFIFYRKYNRRKLLKKNNIITFQQQKLEVEQKQTQTLRKELKESKQINNFVELKERKLEEETRIILHIIQLGEECTNRFQKESFYEFIKKKLIEESTFTNEERGVLFQKVFQYFISYTQEINRYIQLADEDYFVCCLTLLGFSTKYCSVCRGVGEAAIRVQRKRIKEKLKVFFHSDKLYNSIFVRRLG